MWTLGTLIAFPLALLITLALIALGAFAWRADERGFAVGSWVVALLMVIGIASPIGMYPYKAEYHRYEAKSGVVTNVSKRIVGGSDSISEKFVVRFEGSRQEYGCEDTRCAVVEKGDRVTLACKRTWQYAGYDGWDCKFTRNGGAA